MWYVIYKTTGDCFCYNEAHNSWTSHVPSAKAFSLCDVALLVFVMCIKHEHDVKSMCVLEVDDDMFIDFFNPIWDGSKLPFSHLYNMLTDSNKTNLIADAAGIIQTIDYAKVERLIANLDGTAPNG